MQAIAIIPEIALNIVRGKLIFFAIYFFVVIKAKKIFSRGHNRNLEYLFILGAGHLGWLNRSFVRVNC